MTEMQWLVEVVLVALLAATLFHAIRLERALVVLRRDRATFDSLIAGFNDSTRLAEDGAERLRLAADGAGKQISRQTERANALKEDLVFLIERGEKMADTMERLVIDARALTTSQSLPQILAPRPRQPPMTTSREVPVTRPDDATGSLPLRSKAERDLLRALKLGHDR